MLRQGGTWAEVEWEVALEFVAAELRRIRDTHGAQSIGALATPHQTLEELFLLQKLTRGLGSGNVDFRLRQSDFGADAKLSGAPWLGMQIAEIAQLDRVLVVGSTLRKDHPLLAHRMRQAAKRGLQISLVNPVDDDLQMRVAHKAIVAPSALADMLAQVLRAVAGARQIALPESIREAIAAVPESEPARRIAESLASGKNVAVFLGNIAQHHPQASRLHGLAQALSEVTGGRFGFLGEAANSVGGYIAHAVPFGDVPGKNAAQMLRVPLRAYLLLGVEAELDTFDPQQALGALRGADLVVAMSPYQHRAVDYAHVLLPIAPFSETSGTFVSTEGRDQSFSALVRPLGETRPAWKVLRVLGNLLELPGFEYDSSADARAEALRGQGVASRLNNRLTSLSLAAAAPAAREELQRIGEVSIYAADAIVRRAPSLQRTRDAAPPVAAMHPATADRLGLREGDAVRIVQGGGEAVVSCALDRRLPENCIRLAAARPEVSGLGAMFGSIAAHPVPARQKGAA
jgi:NADH-quinone oxidoreductase subunit G